MIVSLGKGVAGCVFVGVDVSAPLAHAEMRVFMWNISHHPMCTCSCVLLVLSLVYR